MQCPQCQFQNRDGAKFCKKCGYKWTEHTSDANEHAVLNDLIEQVKKLNLTEEELVLAYRNDLVQGIMGR